jgi:predicted ATPase
MITELHIINFKSHADSLLRLKPLTVLTGLNGSGKSSVIQSLLLLRQSFKKQRLNEALILNDSLCNIGIGKDAIYQSAKEDFLQFEIKADSILYSWKFSVSENKDFLPLLESKVDSDGNINNLQLFTNDFQYLSAGRLPKFKYERNDLAVESEHQISLENGYGELVAQYLYFWGKENINLELKNNNSNFNDLLNQVIAWEREICPNVNINPQKTGESYTIHYSFDRTGSMGTTDEYKTENAAFGLTYALPVITALLSAKKDMLLLIENPEAHLHPKGQSKLAELIALTANSGIQVIIETHSDHIFNGIRKAVAFNEIKKEKAALLFFELNENNSSSTTEINLSDKGRILNYKKGLFDQFDDDLDALLGLQ